MLMALFNRGFCILKREGEGLVLIAGGQTTLQCPHWASQHLVKQLGH